MDIASAKAAGQIAEKIESLTRKLEELTAFFADGTWHLDGLHLSSASGRLDVIIDIDPGTAKQTISLAIQRYQSQIDALNVELAKL